MRNKKPLSSIVLLMVVLSLLSALGANTIGVSAVVSPCIAVIPESTVDPNLEPGNNFTVSIYTDYQGVMDPSYDYITGYQFALSYNPSVLQIGVSGLDRTDTWTGDNVTRNFYTTGKLIVPGSEKVYVNETLMTKPANYTIDYQIGVISFAFTPGKGADIRATYLYALINGDLIVENPYGNHTKFIAGPFDNVAGELSLTVGYYDEPGEVTPGPGTLANVTFTVVGEGASTITIDSHSKLIGWNAYVPPYAYDIINAAEQPDQIQHGYFQNVATVTHDVAVTSVTPSPTSVLVSDSVDIMVNVTNQGNINESFNVTAYTNATPLGTQNVTNLGSGSTKSLTFTWDTTGAEVGTYNITAVASTVPGETDTEDNTLVSPQTVTLIEPVSLPLAIITAEETEGYVDEDLVFVGVGSYDPDGGAIIAYDWDLGDGTTETGMHATVVHKYDMEGIYTVTLVVTDSQNQVSYPAYLTVAIEEPPTTYDAGLVKWGAKPEAHHWWYSRDDDNMTTITALAGNLGTEPINVSITFAILDAIGGGLAGPVIVEDATLNVTAIDPVSVLLDPYDYGYDETAKVVLYAHVTLKYDSDGDGTPDTTASSVVFRFSIQP